MLMRTGDNSSSSNAELFLQLQLQQLPSPLLQPVPLVATPPPPVPDVEWVLSPCGLPVGWHQTQQPEPIKGPTTLQSEEINMEAIVSILLLMELLSRQQPLIIPLSTVHCPGHLTKVTGLKNQFSWGIFEAAGQPQKVAVLPLLTKTM